MAEIYVSTDVETDGPIPGPHSILSFASAAYRGDKTLLGTFTANLHLLPDDELWDDTMRFNGVAGAFQGNRTLRRLLMPVLRSDYRLIETYRPRLDATIDCPVVACLGEADPAVTAESVQGWQDVTRQGFDFRLFPGDHFYLKSCRDELLAIALKVLGP